MKPFCLILAGLWMILACSHEKKVIERKKSPETIIGMERDTLSIDLDDTSLPHYHTQTAFSLNTNDYLIGYNDQTHALNVFDFTNKVVHNISIYREGKQAVAGEINGLYATSPDSIWILADKTVYLLDTTGMIHEKHELTVDEGEYIINTSNYSNASIQLYIDTHNQSLYYVTLKMGDESIFYINEADLRQGKHKKIVLPYTGAEQGVGHLYGWMQHPNVTFHFPLVIYNFPFNSNVYTFDLHTGTAKSYGADSRYTRNTASETHSATMEDWYRHLIENVHFYEVNYDPYRKCYYRLHVSGVDFTAGMPIDKQLFNKQLFLTVFDWDLNVIEEFLLSNDTYNLNGGWGVFEKGFFIIKDHPNAEYPDDDKMRYDVFRFE
ncbi:DUF4221 family protein [Tannerella sp.]|uniref:DUF4221 family protein n=1 Tax=Tannerella sp. TaxID=2382127 RepID=UPI0026DB4FF2|nr:DUF4221 family protein [Tannerella sp.]MDO4704490.1 DUF4221 family protein [Tannerella sp.]